MLTMEDDGSQSSLSFFTSNHPKHDSSWIFRGCSLQISCVACLIETLEDKDALAIRKRKSLTEIILLLSQDDKLIDILKKNARISSHLCQILLNLLESTQVGVFQISLEGIVQIVMKTQNDVLVREILDMSETKILNINNYRKTYPYIVLIGKITDAIPQLGEELVAHKNKLWKNFTCGLSFPDENVVVALLFLILSVFKSHSAKERTALEIKLDVFKRCCDNIINGKSKDMKMNSLALLQCFASSRDIKNLKLSSSSKESRYGQTMLCNALKKLVLSTDQGLQVGGIQLTTKLLSVDNEDKVLSTTFLACGLAEFLFEALETNNDIVLASLFCCLTKLCNCTDFYRGSYSIYGIDSVVSSVIKSINLQNPETLQQGLHVLSTVISRQNKEVPLFNNGTIFDRCLKISEECLKAMEYKVLQEALYLVKSLLRVDQLPSGNNVTRLLSPLNGVVSVLKRFTTKTVASFSGMQSGTAQEILCQLLEVIHQAVLFHSSYSNKQPSMEESLLTDILPTAQPSNSLQQFDDFIMKAIDETCITAVMVNYEAINNTNVFEIFFKLLNAQLRDGNKEKTTALSKKLVMTSFTRISMEVNGRFCKDGTNISLMKELQCFQKHLIANLNSEYSEDKEMKQKFHLPAIPGSPDEYLTLLSQSCMDTVSMKISDQTLFNIQWYCIELLYLAYCYKDVILNDTDLFRGIHMFVCLNRNLASLPTPALRHLLHLYTDISMTNQGELQFEPAESQRIIVQQLLKFSAKEFRSVSCHTTAFVRWVFQSEVLTRSFSKDTIEHALSMNKEGVALQSLFKVLSSNRSAIRDLMSLIVSEDLCTKVCQTVEGILSETVSTNSAMQVTASQVIEEELQKLLLLNQSKALTEQVLSAILQILLSVQVHKVDGVDMKTFHLVVDILTRDSHKVLSITIAAVNYISVALWTQMRSGRPIVAAVLISNKTFLYWIQKVLTETKPLYHFDDNALVLNVFSVCLILLSSLISSQSRFRIKSSFIIILDKVALLELLNDYRNSIPRLASLVFWGTILDVKTECFVSFSRDDTYINLVEADYKVMLVYLQNALMHESNSIKNVAMKCLEVFMSCGQRSNHCSSNPWCEVILDSNLFSLSPGRLDSHLVHFCGIMLKEKSFSNLEEPLASAAEVIVKEISKVFLHLDDKGQLPTLAEHCVHFLKQLVRSDLPLAQTLSSEQLTSWVKRAHGLASQTKQPRSLCFVKVDQLVLPEDIVTDHMRCTDLRVFPEILQKLTLG